MSSMTFSLFVSLALLAPVTATAQDAPPGHYDAELAETLGADDRSFDSPIRPDKMPGCLSSIRMSNPATSKQAPCIGS